MNIAVVCELNPLHNGHAAIFDFAKTLGGGRNNVIAVMSGNYTQRGEPAIVDKWSRARMAVMCGADMVIEIPSVYAQQSAQFFADAAVDVMCRSGICDALVFGSECGDVGFLDSLAEKKLGGEFSLSLKELLDGGLSYPRAIADVYGCALGANDILGVEYLAALKKRGAEAKVFAMKRVGGANHKETEVPIDGEGIASAAAIRSAVRSGAAGLGAVEKLMPEEAFELFRQLVEAGKYVPSMSAYNALIIGKLREIGADGIGSFPFASGGLAECIYKAACETADVDELVAKATGKNFTSGRIRRTILSTLTGARMDMLGDIISVPYVRVLAVSKDKGDLLSGLYKNGAAVIAGNVPKDFREKFPEKAARLLSCEITATDYYPIGMKSPNEPARRELTVPLLRL
ncbi:MAG: nucleotidyltransferase family protein [Clostridia bacterium]|nr:nucleotidyltransferase family protein [Clostridia bacterium]